MRNALNIWVAIVYLAFNTGVFVNFHYCGNSLNHITVIADPENCCEGDCPCCRNSSVVLKLASEYDASQNFQNTVKSLIEVFATQEIVCSYLLPEEQPEQDSFQSSGPLKLISVQPRYLIYEAFII